MGMMHIITPQIEDFSEDDFNKEEIEMTPIDSEMLNETIESEFE